MENLETYCSSQFLDKLYEKINRPYSELYDDESFSWMGNMLDLINKYCTLIIDITEDELLRRSIDEKADDYNPNYKRLWKNRTTGIVFLPETFDQMTIDNEYFKGKTNELFFLSADNDFCNLVERDRGLICISKDELELKLPSLFIHEIRPILKNRINQDWAFLRSFRYPGNAAIIADNYIFKDRESNELNLLGVLCSILPDQLNETFDLTIFTQEVIDLNKEYEFLTNYLLNNYSYRVNLSFGIVDIGRLGIHDRTIIMNYCWYSSGAGFNLFKRTNDGIRARNDTSVYIFPVTHTGNFLIDYNLHDEKTTPSQKTYFSTINLFKKIWHDLPEKIGTQTKFIGKRINRLLD